MSHPVTAHLFYSVNGVAEEPHLFQSDPFGDFINPVRKHVLSSTLERPIDEWNSTLIEGDPAQYVRDLAASAEGKVTVVGGVQTVRELFVAGAIDELTLTAHPAVTPAGNAMLTYALRPTDA